MLFVSSHSFYHLCDEAKHFSLGEVVQDSGLPNCDTEWNLGPEPVTFTVRPPLHHNGICSELVSSFDLVESHPVDLV